MDKDAAALFAENLESLVRLRENVFKPYGLQTPSDSQRGGITTYTVPEVVSSVMAIPSDIATPGPRPITDYDRLKRIYCVMLWSCWELFKTDFKKRTDQKFEDYLQGKSDLIELRALRNCILHHGSNIVKATSDQSQLTDTQAKLLLQKGTERGYVKFNNLFLEENHLDEFTQMLQDRYREYRKESGL